MGWMPLARLVPTLTAFLSNEYAETIRDGVTYTPPRIAE